jgi:prophage regulatory protein
MARNSSKQLDAFSTPTDDESIEQRSRARKIQFLRLPEVCKLTGLCRSSIYQMEAEGRFPSRVPIGLRAVGWVESEVQDWLRRRIDSRQKRTPSAA